jgi:hypothetical protein
MRNFAAFALLLFALPAAKPVPPEDAPDTQQFLTREAWRGRAVSMCVARLREVRAFTPDDLEGICGCTFDSYLQGHGAEPLPGIGNERIPVAVQGQLASCTARLRPDQLSAVGRLGYDVPRRPPVAAVPAEADGAKPTDEADSGPPAQSDEAGGGFRDWLRSLSLPEWLTGASVLWWIAIGIFVFGLLILKIRGRDRRKDLSAPPSSMRRGAPPQPPRRPDLPR